MKNLHIEIFSDKTKSLWLHVQKIKNLILDKTMLVEVCCLVQNNQLLSDWNIAQLIKLINQCVIDLKVKHHKYRHNLNYLTSPLFYN